MKKSDVLRRAKKFLWCGPYSKGKHEYICHAVGEACQGGLFRRRVNTLVEWEIKNDITNKTSNWASFAVYLAKKIGKDAYCWMSLKEIQQMRLDLMDELIAEYEARGE